MGRLVKEFLARSSLTTLLILVGVILPARSNCQTPIFRVNVQLVRILATVKNSAGELVGTLNKEDFEILDNGVKQEIAIFERRTAQPLSIALLVDTSLSTAIELRYEVDSVNRFLRALFAEGSAEDAVALYSFNYQVTLLSSFTSRKERLEQSLKSIKPVGGTSLYDAIYLASKDLEPRQGRRVIVVVTDGGDTTSVKTFHQALEAAQFADAVLYAILVMPITADAGRNVGGEHALVGLATGTGGRVFTPSVGATLDAAFQDILKELRTQYYLAYYPKEVPASKDRFHRLEVKVHRPDLQVLSRSGYYSVIDSVAGRGSSDPPISPRQ
jgi:Ca-activated chloride channel family protein